MALGAGYPLVDTDAYLYIRFAVAIFAVIVGYFAVQAKQWWWAIPMAAIVVIWNPMFPLDLERVWWLVLQTVAIVVLVTAGAVIKTPVEPIPDYLVSAERLGFVPCALAGCNDEDVRCAKSCRGERRCNCGRDRLALARWHQSDR